MVLFYFLRRTTMYRKKRRIPICLFDKSCTHTVADWDSLSHVVSQTRGGVFEKLVRAFQTLSRAFDFLLRLQKLHRMFGKLGRVFEKHGRVFERLGRVF